MVTVAISFGAGYLVCFFHTTILTYLGTLESKVVAEVRAALAEIKAKV